jgi:hypothetical protein
LWLILCHIEDLSAQWAYEGLQQHGLTPLELVTDQMLGPSLRWNHQIDANGARLEIAFDDKRILSSRAVYGVLNRLRGVPSWPILHKVREGDRKYAEQELAAFFLSWLTCLPAPILNRPTPQGFAGRERHLSEWVLLAEAAGLTTMPYQQSTRARHEPSIARGITPNSPSHSVLVIGQYAFGTAPPDILRCSKRLAMLADTTILGVDFTTDAQGRWLFANTSLLPDLQLGEQPAIDALFELLNAGRKV